MKQDDFIEYFNCLKKLSDIIYENNNLFHVEAFTKVMGIILGDDEVLLDLEINQENFDNEIQKLDNISLTRDEILKVYQLLLLESFKVDNLSYSGVIPSKVGIFLGYLIKRLIPQKDYIKIMDPNISNGNLMINAVKDFDEEKFQFFGSDSIPVFTELSKNIFNLVNYDIKIYLQDPLTITPILKIDFIVSNLESYYLKNHKFYPYEFIKKYTLNLNKNGYMILLLDENFFKNKELPDFKKSIDKDLKMQGIITLPKNLFRNNIKHICIFQKTEIAIEKFLICELPEFENSEMFNRSLSDLNQWLIKKGEETCKK